MQRISSAVALALVAVLTQGCGSSKAPDATVRDLAKDLAQGKVGTLWHALPSSYQADLQQCLGLVVDKLDAQVYDGVCTLAREYVRELRDKPDLVAEVAPERLRQFDFEQHGDAAFGLLDEILTSEIATVAGLQTLDVGRFLDRIGNSIFAMANDLAAEQGQDVGQLASKLQVTVQSESGSDCVLLLQAEGMPMAFPVPFRKVEGKWIPAALAKAWPQAMNELRQSIAAMPSWRDPATRERMLAMLHVGRERLVAVREADTVEELRAAMRPSARPAR